MYQSLCAFKYIFYVSVNVFHKAKVSFFRNSPEIAEVVLSVSLEKKGLFVCVDAFEIETNTHQRCNLLAHVGPQ